MQAPVNPDEHFGLSEMGPVELTGRVRPCPELEHHRAKGSPVIAPRAAAAQLRAPEGSRTRRPGPPIGELHDLSSGVPDAGSTITVARPTAAPREADRVSPGADLTMLAGMAFLIQVVLVDVSRGGRSPAG
jgi:hypothetical protein